MEQAQGGLDRLPAEEEDFVILLVPSAQVWVISTRAIVHINGLGKLVVGAWVIHLQVILFIRNMVIQTHAPAWDTEDEA